MVEFPVFLHSCECGQWKTASPLSNGKTIYDASWYTPRPQAPFDKFPVIVKMYRPAIGFLFEVLLVLLAGFLTVYPRKFSALPTDHQEQIDAVHSHVEWFVSALSHSMASFACGFGFLLWIFFVDPDGFLRSGWRRFLLFLLLPVICFTVIIHLVPLGDLYTMVSEKYGHLGLPLMFVALSLASKVIHWMTLSLPSLIFRRLSD